MSDADVYRLMARLLRQCLQSPRLSPLAIANALDGYATVRKESGDWRLTYTYGFRRGCGCGHRLLRQAVANFAHTLESAYPPEDIAPVRYPIAHSQAYQSKE